MTLKEQPLCINCKHFENRVAITTPLSLRMCKHEKAGQKNIVDGRTYFSMAVVMRQGECGPYGRYYQEPQPVVKWYGKVVCFVLAVAVWCASRKAREKGNPLVLYADAIQEILENE